MTDMPGAQVHTLTGAYVCDALGAEERAVFEEHLSECPECSTEVGELREVTALMAAAVSQRPPESLKAAVDARIRVTRQAPPITDPVTGPSPGPMSGPMFEPSPGQAVRHRAERRLRAAWAAAAALVLLVAGLGWHAIDQQHRIDALNAQATGISQLLAAPDAAAVRVPVNGGGSALVVDSRGRDEAAVSFTGLAGAPAGKTYQLWLIAPSGSARSVGLMKAAPPAPILIRGLAGQDEVGMTLEPAGGSPRPTTAPVMVAALGA